MNNEKIEKIDKEKIAKEIASTTKMKSAVKLHLIYSEISSSFKRLLVIFRKSSFSSSNITITR